MCLATAAQIVTGAASIGTLTTYVAGKLRSKIEAKKVSVMKTLRRNDHEQQSSTTGESRFAG
jgi:hypothetical protein